LRERVAYLEDSLDALTARFERDDATLRPWPAIRREERRQRS